MEIKEFIQITGAEFFTGVPDSQLKPLCDYLFNTYGISDQHVIAANEGNCAALAAGYYLATGKTPLVYLQNSGIGNILNPVASLLHSKVYGIPCIFIVGWRGEPGVKDEPQHIFQGEATLPMLSGMDLEVFILDKNTSVQEFQKRMEEFKGILAQGRSVAVVVRKGAFNYDLSGIYLNNHVMRREEIIEHIAAASDSGIVVSTTGKASRELFEIRERRGENHDRDFLTVGSMGHCSSIALGIAMARKDKKVWCIDGDGAALMHLGAMAVIGSQRPGNLVHIILNNGAHETVGGMPTVAKSVEFTKIALGCGYERAASVDNFKDLDRELERAKKENILSLIEAKTALGARENLGRPTISAGDNKESFIKYIRR